MTCSTANYTGFNSYWILDNIHIQPIQFSWCSLTCWLNSTGATYKPRTKIKKIQKTEPTKQWMHIHEIKVHLYTHLTLLPPQHCLNHLWGTIKHILNLFPLCHAWTYPTPPMPWNLEILLSAICAVTIPHVTSRQCSHTSYTKVMSLSIFNTMWNWKIAIEEWSKKDVYR